ncbi:protein prenylyltransferase [Setomelanomma holmii]|uniref:Protein prenylyltransferase n=1 Tax=Setomelanomma holmii TaxID=210430 RepID=A0A9P4HL24_9PLEO|nr:protein prenylyltransferase [Setomelanomma holmii]
MSENPIAVVKLQKQAYAALTKYFRAHDKQVVEIEVLPPAIQPPDGLLLQDGRCLGVPKEILALAYIEARTRFFANVKDGNYHSLALEATKVMLLFDPEHLSAANFRKRRLVALRAKTSPDGELIYRKAVKYEFCFLDSILTSPLHRQSKSPTLWYHRFWLLMLLCPNGLRDVPEQLRADFWRTELSTVCKSGERHPKNYYAWQYARNLMSRIDDREAMVDCAQHIKDWCCKHPSDISGWSFLAYLIPEMERAWERENIVRDVIRYAMNFHSENESLWMFLRTILTHGALQEGRDGFVAVLQKYGTEIEHGQDKSGLARHVQQILTWIEKNVNSVDDPDAVIDSTYGSAERF